MSSQFHFEVTPETELYCSLIVLNLRRFGVMSEQDATDLVNQAFANDPKFPDDDYRLHESPYYTAMCILHHPTLGDNRPEWWKDEELWPPPQDLISEW